MSRYDKYEGDYFSFKYPKGWVGIAEQIGELSFMPKINEFSNCFVVNYFGSYKDYTNLIKEMSGVNLEFLDEKFKNMAVTTFRWVGSVSYQTPQTVDHWVMIFKNLDKRSILAKKSPTSSIMIHHWTSQEKYEQQMRDMLQSFELKLE